MARWASRELGVRAAYAQMAGVADTWVTSDAAIPGHAAPLLTLDGAPRISVVFLRLPDGWLDGSGTAANGYQSLQKLLEGQVGSVAAVDGSSAYTRPELTGALATLMRTLQPDTIRTQTSQDDLAMAIIAITTRSLTWSRRRNERTTPPTS